jgi:hypothetical protein
MQKTLITTLVYICALFNPMRQRQKKYALVLLWLFATISTFPYFAPEAPPLDSPQTRIVIMVEEGHNYQGDILRSASDIQKEDPRQDDLHVISQVGSYHSEIVSTQTSQNRASQLDVRAERTLYLSNSCFLI